MKKFAFINIGIDLVIFSAGVALLTGVTFFLISVYESLIAAAI